LRSLESPFTQGCVIKHAALKKIQPSPSGLTPLTAVSTTSLPDRNFHTGGDYAAAAVSYACDFKSSRDTPHDTKEPITPGSFTNYLLTSSMSFQSTQQFNTPNGVSTNQPPRGDHFMEVEVNPPSYDRPELTLVLIRRGPLSSSICNELGWRPRLCQPRHTPRRPMPTSFGP
jgi:hypothetical protein